MRVTDFLNSGVIKPDLDYFLTTFFPWVPLGEGGAYYDPESETRYSPGVIYGTSDG